MRRISMFLATVSVVFVACQKPLPVQHPEDWYDVDPTYPPLQARPSRDGGSKAPAN